MALKLPDSAVPMGDFPVAKAVDIDFDDGENLQEKLDNGNLGGGGTVDLSEYTKTFTSLSALGLTAPVSVGEIFNAMPNKTIVVLSCEDTANHITDVPTSFGILTIKKNEQGRFSIDYQNSLASSSCNVKRWIGTLKGVDGTELYWRLISTQPTYVALSDMGLTADATVQDVIDKLQVGESCCIRTDSFSDLTQFANIQWGYLKITKTVNSMCDIWLNDVTNSENLYFGKQLSGKFNSWVKITTNNAFTTTINNFSSNTQIPTARTVATLHNGKNLSEGTDVLRLNVGVHNIASDGVARACTNLPSASAGKLTIRSVQGDDGLTPYTGTYKYQVYEYRDIKGSYYVCTVVNNTSTVSPDNVIVYGWYKVATSVDLTAVNTKITALETKDTTIENRLTTLEENANDLFQSVSDGKTLVANAITDKGVSTSSTDTFATMASNIRNINVTAVGYNSEKKSGNVRVESGYTATISITFSNTVLGVTAVDYDWDDNYLTYNGFSVSGNTVTVKIELSSTYGNSYRTVSCTVNANILA